MLLLHKQIETWKLKFLYCRPYTGDFDGTDPQRKLFLPDPVLPSGDTPSGFLGYAVNLVDLDDEHLHTVTTEGHNLRQTLLYSLFGELHVYRTRKHMFNARACIKHAAVSLDGGILKQTGIVSLGYGYLSLHLIMCMFMLNSLLCEQV